MKKLKAFSLIEMIITLGIMAIVMLIATQTLNTMVRVSTITKYKTMARNELDFSVELVDRLLSNSNIADVYLYDSNNDNIDGNQAVRTISFNTETGDYDISVTDNYINDGVLESFYDSELQPGISGNEIHFRPYGYSIWVCLGYFRDTADEQAIKDGNYTGYFVKRTVTTLQNGHGSCFDLSESPNDPLLVLTSEDVDVRDFDISYTQSTSNNNIFYVDMRMEPVPWVNSSHIDKSVFRQAIVTTQGLTWY